MDNPARQQSYMKSSFHRIGVMLAILPFLLVGAGLHYRVTAQQSVKFSHLTVKEGLSQGTVQCILQDRQGFMWFGTQDGLNRYDGYSITPFKHDPAIRGTINGNFIILLAEDSARVLWIGTLESPEMLNSFDPNTETFTQVNADSVNLAGARINSSRSQYVDASGVKWIGARDVGLRRVDSRTGKSTVYKHDPSKPTSIIHDNVYQIVGDQSGLLWVTTSGGLERLDPKTEVFTHFKHDDKDSKSLSDNETWPMLMDRHGRLWVGTYQGGLNLYDRATESFTRFMHDEADPRSIAGNTLYSIYQDRSGMIWIGTSDHGVDRFHPEIFSFPHIVRHPDDPAGLSENNIQSIAVEPKGIVWIGTRDGLNRWDRATGRFSVFRHDAKNPNSVADNIAQSILIDHTGIIWAGTNSNGLDRLDPGASKFVHYRSDPSRPGSLSDNGVYALLEDRKADLWVGTYSGGLNRFDRATGSFKAYRHSDSVTSSIAADGVWSFLEDRDGVLWVGTYGGGLDRFNPEIQAFTHFSHSETDSTSISDNNILSLCEDRAGNMWVGTMGGGLNLFDRGTGKFMHFRERNGLPSDMVLGVLEDQHGLLWLSTAKGICRFDPKGGAFKTYDYNDGLQGNEFNQGAYAKDVRTGELFFGGPNGFNVFHPDHVKDNPFVPPLVFSSFTRYNTDDAAGRPIAEKGISVKPHVVVSYKDNINTFEFSALNYYNSHKNRYSYQLEGFGDNWIQLGTDRRATFTNLDGGEYVLHIRGSNNDGVWNDTGAMLRLTVTPPWWKTTWAYGMYAVLVVGFLYTARRVEINRREQKTKMRESELRAKAMEAEKRALQAENDRQTKELEDARILQLSMLPKEVPRIPGYDISVFMKTATEVGGDYYDFNVTQDGMLNVAFGDATGHGMQAGTIVTLMKGLFISDAAKFEIRNFFNHCSKAIKDIKLGRLYMAFTLARFNGKSVSLSSAGMPPVYLYKNSSGAIEEILLKAVPLGSMKNFPYGLYETVMEKGDTMLFLTDGLPEQKNAAEEMFDYARVIDGFKSVAASSPAEIVGSLVKEAEAWLNGAAQDDDITLLVIKKTE